MQTHSAETGLATLMAEGLPLDEEAGHGAVFEPLRWLPAEPPPADSDTHLLQVVYSDGVVEVFSGWWSTDCWRHAATGAEVIGQVRYYADPKGPSL